MAQSTQEIADKVVSELFAEKILFETGSIGSYDEYLDALESCDCEVDEEQEDHIRVNPKMGSGQRRLVRVGAPESDGDESDEDEDESILNIEDYYNELSDEDKRELTRNLIDVREYFCERMGMDLSTTKTSLLMIDYLKTYTPLILHHVKCGGHEKYEAGIRFPTWSAN